MTELLLETDVRQRLIAIITRLNLETSVDRIAALESIGLHRLSSNVLLEKVSSRVFASSLVNVVEEGGRSILVQFLTGIGKTLPLLDDEREFIWELLEKCRSGNAFVGAAIAVQGDIYLGIKEVQGSETLSTKTRYVPPLIPNNLLSLKAIGPLPPGSFLPYNHNPSFLGREPELQYIASNLLLSTSDQVSTVAITGIGGVGKTQLAIEFAYRFGRFFTGGVQWVSFSDEDAIQTAIAQCGNYMGLHPNYDKISVADQVALVQHEWAGPIDRLIIFDDCDSQHQVAAWRPKGGGSRLLITSRRGTEWPDESRSINLLLPTLPHAHSLALLREYLNHGDSPQTYAEEGLAEIAVELGGLPLALHLAGSYLESYAGDPKGTPAALLAELRDPELMLRGAALSGRAAVDSPTGHDPHVANTFLLSLRALERKAPDVGLAKALLARAACLAPGEPFPAALLRATIDEGIDSLDVSDALRALEQVGLLERAGSAAEAATPGGACRLHRLIGRFVAGELAEEMDVARAAVEGTVSRLAYQQTTAGDPRALREWEIHLRHATDAAFDREDDDAATLCNNLGYYLQMSGDLAGARPYYEQALAVYERVLGPEHPHTATAVNNMGRLLSSMGDLAGARPYFERALAVREHVLGPEHPDTASSLNNLGALLSSMGDLAGTRPYYERALAISERVLGPEHPQTAASLNNLGGLLKAMGDLAGARPYLESALAIRERVLGPEHPDTASSLNNLGALLSSMGDLTEARPYFERALAISERVLGPGHPDMASSLNNLGALLSSMGDLAGARSYFERALAILERVLGPEHPDTAQSLNNLGMLLQAMGDLAGARPYLERALAIRERVLGPEHPDTAQSLNNMGYLLQAMGDLAGARPYFEQALAIRERVLGPEHLDTARSLNNMAILCYYEGDLPAAADLMRRALAIREKVLDPNHPDTRGARDNLAVIEEAMRRS